MSMRGEPRPLVSRGPAHLAVAVGATLACAFAALSGAQDSSRTTEVVLKLHDGRPAADAAVVITASLAEAPAWGYRCDPTGRVAVPHEAGSGWLAARHPDAGFLLLAWNPGQLPAAVEHRLPKAAALLLARTVDSRERPVGRAHLALLVGDRRLSGALLGWLTRTPGMSDADGYWRALGLPETEVRLLAWRATDRLDSAVQDGTYDDKAITLTPPWPGLAMLPVLRAVRVER